ncbi:hypothetical protein HDU96_007612 [Phlyctochytrium bullatum]|nr:hypothetical protein HDU96_007612 [Phlyctochytrium bullatum]
MLSASKTPAFYLSHGAPPSLLSPSPEYELETKAFWNSLSQRPDIRQAKGFIFVSAHWYRSADKAHSHDLEMSSNGKIVFDFGELFPGVLELGYTPASFTDELWKPIKQLKGAFDLKVSDHGLDHGVWIPLKHVLGEELRSQLPALQIQLPSEDLHDLVKLGEMLAPLREQGYVIVASGGAVHPVDMQFFERIQRGGVRALVDTKPESWGYEFEQVLTESLAKEHPSIDAWWAEVSKKKDVLQKAHPTIDHLVPVVVAWATSTTGRAAKVYDAWSGDLGMQLYEFE